MPSCLGMLLQQKSPAHLTGGTTPAPCPPSKPLLFVAFPIQAVPATAR